MLDFKVGSYFSIRSRRSLGNRFEGQRLHSRNPVHQTRSMALSTLSSRNNGSQPAKAEIAQERTLSSITGKNKSRRNCDAKTQKCNILCLKKSEKSEHIFMQPTSTKKSIILVLFWQTTSTA